jgi:hypothetical protein
MSAPENSTGAWQHGADVARVDTPEMQRRAVLNLERLDQPAVLLEGAALIIHDAVNGERDTQAIIDLLTLQFPGVPMLAQEVTETLEQLAATGIIWAPNGP